MVYCFKVLKSSSTGPEIEEAAAPDILRASQILADRWPRIQLIKLEGMYPEGQKGTA